VLVATASANLQNIICRVLGRNGYNADPVSSAAAAIEATRTSEYEAIITDMHLPDCCGATLVDSLRRQGVSTPAILLVEEETPRIREAVSRLGSTQCIAGAADLDRLKAAVAKACRHEHIPGVADDEPPTSD
jgi:DNA-binding response OmpR family regulator